MTTHDSGLRPFSSGRTLCLSGNGRGAIAKAIDTALIQSGRYSVVLDEEPQWRTPDVAICTFGALRIQRPATVLPEQLAAAHEANYAQPRNFIEKMVRVMRRDQRRGLILVLGSNAAWYGNTGADDYAAYKSALRKYCETRGHELRADGIRLCYLALGAVATPFWFKATVGAESALVATIAPNPERALQPMDVAHLVGAIADLPAGVSVRELLAVSVEYQ